jgi:hypothetical protein
MYFSALSPGWSRIVDILSPMQASAAFKIEVPVSDDMVREWKDYWQPVEVADHYR